ncbi:HEAT repeat domain-containing protein [Mycobacterium sp. Aquia_213]|uniref:HEAT repeat domain-containing protein n=1 Tax=Mycobacterium sp. Aquia_213 TaxID=2991728 RepID=UPI00226E8347|nr:hypothetical protein [Mycobacterium sp. Aquia_213]WAC91168.1 hypothetical protein LMQ14_25410 [Mycobacterium sp. Aquia_213]
MTLVQSPQSLLEDTDWSSLEHAYGPAGEAPFELLHLLTEDAELCGNAIAFLDSAVLHQDTIYSATAPAALFVAAILDDVRTRFVCDSTLPWDDRERPVRAALLEWLGRVAAAAAWEELEPDDDLEDEDTGAVEACRAIRPDVYTCVAPFLDDPDAGVRQEATTAMAHLLQAPELAEFRAAAAERLLRQAADAPPVERAGIALTVGAWGIPPAMFLADEHPGVRACAALTAAHDGVPAALEEIRSALRDPRAADALFDENPPLIWGQMRFALIEALLRRTATFDEIVDEAVAVARMTNAHTVQSDWGPMLVRAFPEAFTSTDALSENQRRFLVAIVENDECWGVIANPYGWLRGVGLPTERDELRSLVDP